MKVGTLNFHRSQNYGALMVTYSLITYLKKIGIDAHPIDYFPEHHTSMYPNKNEPYDNFVKEYLTPFHNINDEFDLIIYGADTIWEYYNSFGYDSTYWGSDKLKSKHRIVFSASGTMKNFSYESDELFKQYIKDFDYVSVREDVLADYLYNLTNINIVHTCDPTFLLAYEDYKNIMAERLINTDYAVIYNRQLSKNAVFKAAQTVEEKIGLCVFVMLGDGCLYESNGNFIRNDIGPREFLSMIAHSVYVLANSFHAVVFSVIFKKQFNTIMKSGSERVDSLLRKLKLIDRKIDHTKEIDVTHKIDYGKLTSLDQYIDFSKKYLDEAICGVIK